MQLVALLLDDLALDDESRDLAVDANAAKRFGDYELKEEIARGGMGVVYRARQLSLNRDVALKMILAGQLATPESVQRFRVEARAAAKLDHPGIVPVYEIGEHESQQFFSMRLIDGGNLSERRDEYALPHPTTPSEAHLRQREIARLISKVARALDYAHRHGVLHRDLKPTNILIDRHGDPYLTDFGLAKLTGHESSGLTLSMAVLGSPSYMAPEQALGNTEDTTIAADVYGLGAALYELLTRRPPFLGESAMATLSYVIHDSPKRPRQLNPLVDVDLETVVLKCLEKEPQSRYSSAAEVAEELDRYLSGLPVQARPVSQLEHLLRWCRRSPWIAGLTAALTVTLLIGLTGILWQWHRANASNKQLRASMEESEWHDIVDMTECDKDSQALAHLAARLRRVPNDWQAAMTSGSILHQRQFGRLRFPPVSHGGAAFSCATYSPDGSRFATAAADGTARVWDSRNGSELCRAVHAAAVNHVAFSPSGQFIVTASEDSTSLVWNLTSAAEQFRFAHDGPVNMALFTPGGERIISASDDGKTRIFDARQGHLVETIAGDQSVVTIDLNPNGDQLLVGCSSGDSAIWSIAMDSPAQLVHRFPPLTNLRRCRFAADGRRVVRNSSTRVECWNMETKERIYDGPNRPVFDPAISQQRNVMLADASNRALQIIDLETGRARSDRIPSVYSIHAGAFDRDGRNFAVGGLDYAVWIRDANTLRSSVSPTFVPSISKKIEFSPDGKHLLVVMGKPDFLTDAPPEQTAALVLETVSVGEQFRLKPIANRTTTAAISADGALTVIGDTAGRITLFDRQFTPIRTLPPSQSSPLVVGLAITPDRKRVVAGNIAGKFSIFSVDSDESIVEVDSGSAAHCYRLSPQGDLLAVGGLNGKISFWDVATGQPRGEVLDHGGGLNDVTFSGDGRWLVTASDKNTAKVWELATGRCLRSFTHAAAVQTAKFSPDERHLVTASNDFSARVWDVQTGEAIGQPMVHRGEVGFAAFHPQGKRILTAARDGTARVWDAFTGKPLTPRMIHATSLREANYSPDGRLIVTVDHEALRVWDAESGLRIGVPIYQPSGEGIGFDSAGVRTPFHPDGRFVLWTMVVPEVRRCDTRIPPTPVPRWYPDFLELVGGQTLDTWASPQRIPLERARRSVEAWASEATTTDRYYAELLDQWRKVNEAK